MRGPPGISLPVYVPGPSCCPTGCGKQCGESASAGPAKPDAGKGTVESGAVTGPVKADESKGAGDAKKEGRIEKEEGGKGKKRHKRKKKGKKHKGKFNQDGGDVKQEGAKREEARKDGGSQPHTAGESHRKKKSKPAGEGTVTVQGSEGGGLKRYSRRWWFWTKEGRQLWRQCREKGEASPFWGENQCAKREKPAKGTKWWWWTSTGRTVWKECKEKGEASPFWKENDCEAGRCIF